MIIFFIVQIFSGDDPGGQTNPIIIDNGAGNVTVEGGDTIPDPSQPGGGGSIMQILLSEGNPNPDSQEPVPQATGEPLTEEEIAQIFERLPELAVEPEDQVDFRLPEQILPPPRTGETIPEPFPVAEAVQPPLIDSGPLEVLRFAPEGEIPLAPFINVTFSQPMVPLTTREALAELEVPVQVTPDLPGTWSWVGTKTLTFEFELRSDRSIAHGDCVSDHHPGWNAILHRRRIGGICQLDFHYPPSPTGILLSFLWTPTS